MDVADAHTQLLESVIEADDALMERCGWPAIQYDGKLLVTQQDALLMGGKVQAPAGYADHVVFVHPELPLEVWRVTLTNRRKSARDLSWRPSSRRSR